MLNWLKAKGLLYFLRLGLMAVLTSFNFWLAVIRWGWSDANPVIKTSAMLVAGTTEVGLFAFLVLFHLVFYSSPRRKRALVGWGLAAVACVGVSLYVNIGYFSINWQDQSGNTLADLLIRALFPMALLLAFSMIPPKVVKLRTAEDVQRDYAAKLEEARLKQELAQIESHAKDARRERQERERQKQIQLRRIAGAILREYETVDEDENIVVDWLGLEADLRARRLYPVEQNGLDALPTIDAQLATALVADMPPEETMEEDDARSQSGNHRSFINAREIATILDVSPDVAKDMIEAFSKHKYAIKGAKNIRLRRPVRGRSYERRAPYAAVLEIKAKLEADRAAKLRPFPRPQDEQERA